MPSVPPPSQPPPEPGAGGAPSAPPAQERVIALEGGERNVLRLTAERIALEHARVMHSPLELPLASIKVATVEAGPARATGQFGRFAVLRRMSATSVIPRAEGIEGWLWTSTGGTGLTNLGPDHEAPNTALVFARPLDETRLRGAFDPDFVTALAARSPLGNPTVLGVLFRVEDTYAAEQGFRRWGFQSVLTDREVPPPLRKHLPTDRPADPAARGTAEDPRTTRSVPPPGFS